MAEQTTEPEGRPRASGWLACGVVVGIAVLVTGGVVGWARLGSGPATRGPPEPTPLDEPVPESLAGGIELGEVPDALAEAFDGPVVAARLLTEVPAGVDCGFIGHDFDDEPQVEEVLALPDMVHVSMVGTGSHFGPPGEAQRVRATCTARWEGGGWVESGGGIAPVDAGMGMGGGTSSSCCDQDGLGTAETTVSAPDGAQWAVQARGRYHLAYPVPDSRVVQISWRVHGMRGGFGGFDGAMAAAATSVTFVDAAGEVIGEVTIRA